jgi:predicted nucleotidyltransferase
MTAPVGLASYELQLILGVLSRHPAVTGAILFGSRAKGTSFSASDIDLALEGIDDSLQAEAIASELDDLPLPYHFDVKALAAIRSQPLRDHIARVGTRIHRRSG